MKEIIDELVLSEGLRLKAYQCSAGVWTIGIGSTFYKDGRPVKKGDVITKEDAYKLAEDVALKFADGVKRILKPREVTKNQFTALVSLAYNIGLGALAKTTLMQIIKANPNDPAIKERWHKTYIIAAGKTIPGLILRRQREAKLYFTV